MPINFIPYATWGTPWSCFIRSNHWVNIHRVSGKRIIFTQYHVHCTVAIQRVWRMSFQYKTTEKLISAMRLTGCNNDELRSMRYCLCFWISFPSLTSSFVDARKSRRWCTPRDGLFTLLVWQDSYFYVSTILRRSAPGTTDACGGCICISTARSIRSWVTLQTLPLSRNTL